jgi:hypothetical protein
MVPYLPAAPKVVPDTTVPAAASTLNALDATVRGGIYRAPTITLPAGMRLKLASDLILVADLALVIDGEIDFAAGMLWPVNVTLVSLQGTVTVSASGKVGPVLGAAAAGVGAQMINNPNALAQGQPGVNGGFIKIVAANGAVLISGLVRSLRGGDGGGATARCGPVGPGGTARAAGGQAGAGGDVLLAAMDGIRINGIVDAGGSGRGGPAWAEASPGGVAEASGGPGNSGGDIYFEGFAAQMAVDILQAQLNGGSSQPAGQGGADIAPGVWKAGGAASANGGVGGSGGTVIFNMINCEVNQYGQIDAGNGGEGGAARAVGGDGARGNFQGWPGGAATAIGGKAGPAGALPQIPVSGGVDQGGVFPQIAAFCKGGNANATGGIGGGSVIGFGGDSGTGVAQGGTGCSGIPAARMLTGPVPGRFWGPGGVCPPATSPGTP